MTVGEDGQEGRPPSGHSDTIALQRSLDLLGEDGHEDRSPDSSRCSICSKLLSLLAIEVSKEIDQNGIEDRLYMDFFRNLWRETLKEGLTVAAFVEDQNGGKPILAGLNMNTLRYEDDIHMSIAGESKKAQQLITVYTNTMKKAGIFEKYGVDRYLGAVGLSVHPSFRGAALGGHILDV
ncbi:uncharacterized protein LOC144477458, partial [Augochlora pura]